MPDTAQEARRFDRGWRPADRCLLICTHKGSYPSMCRCGMYRSAGLGLQANADHVLFSRLQVPCPACLVADGTAILIEAVPSNGTVEFRRKTQSRQVGIDSCPDGMLQFKAPLPRWVARVRRAGEVPTARLAISGRPSWWK